MRKPVCSRAATWRQRPRYSCLPVVRYFNEARYAAWPLQQTEYNIECFPSDRNYFNRTFFYEYATSNMALFQIMSDLHLETYPSYKHFKMRYTDASYIALLGDIGHVCNNELFKWFRLLLQEYNYVFYLLGNHDTKNYTMSGAKARIARFQQELKHPSESQTLGEFIFLDQTRFDIGFIAILGCTLFSHIRDDEKVEVGSRFVDFKDTRDWTVEKHNVAHRRDVEWLNEQVDRISREEPSKHIVIFTHHSPTKDLRAKDQRFLQSTVSSGFETDLSAEPCWTNPAVKVWFFGHTHFNCNFVDETTGKRVMTNQKGYFKFPKEDFDGTVMYQLPEGKSHKYQDQDSDLEEPQAQAALPSPKPQEKGGLWSRMARRLSK